MLKPIPACGSALAVAFVLATAAEAASPAASDPFARTVEDKCLDAAAGLFRRPQVAVDPFGSENFGMAIVHGRIKGEKGRKAVICIVDRDRGTVELGSELGQDIVRIRKARPLDENGDPVRRNRNRADSDGEDDNPRSMNRPSEPEPDEL